MTGPLGIAYLTGMLATVNPCGFAMLPAFLAFYVGTGTDTGRSARPLLAGLRAGVAVSAGFAIVFTLTGLLVAAGLRAIVTQYAVSALDTTVVLDIDGRVLDRIDGRPLDTNELRSFLDTTLT